MEANVDQQPLLEQEPPEVDDEEQKTLLRKAAALIQTGLQALTDAKAIVEELRGGANTVKTTDENGEPTFRYLVKVAVPENIYCTKHFLEYAQKYGFDAEQARILMNGAPPGSDSKYEGFRKYYQRMLGQPNGKWTRWDLVWFKWVREQRDRKKEQDAKKSAGGPTTRFGQLRARGRS